MNAYLTHLQYIRSPASSYKSFKTAYLIFSTFNIKQELTLNKMTAKKQKGRIDESTIYGGSN